MYVVCAHSFPHVNKNRTNGENLPQIGAPESGYAYKKVVLFYGFAEPKYILQIGPNY